MGQIKCKMTHTLLTSACAFACLWLCCYPYTVMSSLFVPHLVCLWVSAVLRASHTRFSSFWKKRRVSCPGQRCDELVLRTGSLTTLTEWYGPSATRLGACPSAAGQSLCAYRPEAREREKWMWERQERNARQKGQMLRWNIWGDWTSRSN